MADNITQNLNSLMSSARDMQKRMEDAQAALKRAVVTGQAGAGMVKIQMNGAHEVISLDINQALFDEDKQVFCDVVAAAFREAVRQVEELSRKTISELTAGLNIPPEFMGDGDKK